MNRRLRIGFTAILLISTTGCGQAVGGNGAVDKISNTVAVNSTTTIWIESSGIGQPNRFYKLTNTIAQHIGNVIWSNRSSANGPGSWIFPDLVVAVCDIPGRDANKVIAAKLIDGSYVEADFVGNKQP